MKTALAVIAVLIVPICRPPCALSQTPGRVQILELHFASDSAGTPTIDLKKGTVYWAELDGRGDLLLQSVRSGRQAFIVPVEEGSEPRRFQIYPLESGLHGIALIHGDSGVVTTLRLYRDEAETARIRDSSDRGVAIGLSFAGGLHTGLGIDSLGGTDPSGGGDLEGCLLLRSGETFALCPGAGRQTFPDAGLSVGWIFLEGQLRLMSKQLFSDRNTDLSGTFRFSKATGVGSRNTYPEMFGLGLQLVQHIASGGHRRGISVLSAWQHGWLNNAPDSQDRSTDRFMAGLIWLP